MPKNIIPKQNFPKVEEVRYLENQKPQKDKKSETPPANNNQQTPIKEIFKNLIWKNQKGQEFYRVFGSWKCDNQKKSVVKAETVLILEFSSKSIRTIFQWKN